MNVGGDWIEARGTRAVCDMLTEAGHQALFVGGCVRNALLGAPIADIDIATDAHPETVVTLATRAGLNPVPTGIDHGTVTVVAHGIPHEVTTFRRDVETDGRRAVVAFSDRIEEDAARRDFTMNALYATPEGAVVDPLGTGVADIAARSVRFVGAADERIREDYLRSLRFFRFHAWYGNPEAGLDADGLAAIAANLAGLETLSRERLGSEMLKLLAAPDPAPSVAAMRATGVLGAVLPGSDDTALAPLVHLEGLTGLAPDPVRRLAAIAPDTAAATLRLSRSQEKAHGRLRDAATSTMGAPELGYRVGAAAGLDALVLRAALLSTPLQPDARSLVERGAAAVFPVKAADLADRFSGPALGHALREAEARWIASGFALGRTDLLA